MTRQAIRMRASSILFFSAIIALPCLADTPAGWKKEDVSLRLPGGSNIKAIYYPNDNRPRMAKDAQQPLGHSARLRYPLSSRVVSATGQISPVLFNVIDSPPIDGFVAYVAAIITSAHSSDELDWAASPGSIVTTSLLDNYAVGIFDTGASTTLFGYYDASTTGIYSRDLVTTNTIGLKGATGTTTAYVSSPLGLFAAGIAAIDPNEHLHSATGMKGQTNVSVVVGDVPDPCAIDLPTAIGAPFSVFYSTSFDNEHKVTRTRGSNEYSGRSAPQA